MRAVRLPNAILELNSFANGRFKGMCASKAAEGILGNCPSCGKCSWVFHCVIAPDMRKGTPVAIFEKEING